jgi:glycosyltransferase involved in cell wall biosynthesis
VRVTHLITSLDTGGAEMMLWKLVSGLEREGFHSNVICLGTMGEVGNRIAKLGVSVHALGLSRMLPNPLAVFRLARTIRNFRPDLVHSWMYHANLLGSLARGIATDAPLVWSLRQANLDRSVNRRRTLRIVRACAMLSNRASAIVLCSEASRQPHVEFGYPAEKMQVIPNGFDTDVFRPNSNLRSEVRRELGIACDTPLLGLFGRFDPQKDQRTFIRAASELAQRRPGARFLLCGTDITWQNTGLARWIDEAGIRASCVLLGHRDDIPRLMAALDILVSSSCGEGFSNVIGEAMACGVACVVTDVGDSALVVGSAGRVVPPHDSHALAEACLQVLNMSAEQRQNLAFQARSRVVNNFSLDAVVGAYIRLYDSLAVRSHMPASAMAIGKD